jgi:hypothetical protein
VIAIHAARLAKLIHRSKSFVNSLLHPLSATMHKMSKGRALGLMARFPMLRLEAIGCWTFREIQPRLAVQPPSQPERVTLPSVCTLLEGSWVSPFPPLSQPHVPPSGPSGDFVNG